MRSALLRAAQPVAGPSRLRSVSTLRERLDSGPSLDDFIAGDITAEERSTVKLGNTAQCAVYASAGLMRSQTSLAKLPQVINPDQRIVQQDQARSSCDGAMPKIRTSRTKAPPEGYDEIESVLDDYARKMRDAESSDVRLCPRTA